MELRLEIDDSFMSTLQHMLRLTRSTDVVREALTILNWAVRECYKGRVIVSAQIDGSDAVRLAMPSLDNTRI